MSQVTTEVRRYIEDNFVFGTGTPFSETDSFIEHRILDSTGFMELIAFLEETYAIKVLDDEMLPENLDTLEAIDTFVARKRKAA
jgi:acyl carrier protein